jgi:GEVED domain/Secretion system C-terminal sorting domain
MDLGDATTSVPIATNTTGPLFRSYTPSTSRTRFLPNMTSILAGATSTPGLYIASEVLPVVARTMNFRLTVRDNKVFGSANNTDDIIVSVDGNSGPFLINSQNSTTSYVAGTTQIINWSVAGTNANGINCAHVDILLSTNGGNTFAITLLSATPNNGTANVVIPNITGTANRIMVRGTNQIFFDVNNANFTITSSNPADSIAPTGVTLSASGTTTTGTTLSWTTATDNVAVSGYEVYQNGILKTIVSNTSLVVSGLSASTSFSFYVKAKDAAGNLSSNSNALNVITLANTSVAYCSSNGNSTSNEFINKVQIGSINNFSGNNNGYGNFTSMSTNLATGTNNTIVITPAWNGTNLNEGYNVWIDFNKDGDFGDNGELVFSKSKTKATLVSGNFIIPTNAIIGTTRMRVAMKYNSLPTQCEIFSYGEVEDYTVSIISGVTARAIGSNEESTTNKTDLKLEVSKLTFKLYPNPVNESMIYFEDIETNLTYKIFNSMGQEMANGSLENKEINVDKLVGGTYIIELTDGAVSSTKRFIKL